MPTSKGLALVKPFAFASLAQQVEHAAVNRRVVGSNPTGGAKGIAATLVTAISLAPPVGFEPTTLRLTAGCSTVELRRHKQGIRLSESLVLALTYLPGPSPDKYCRHW